MGLVKALSFPGSHVLPTEPIPCAHTRTWPSVNITLFHNRYWFTLSRLFITRKYKKLESFDLLTLQPYLEALTQAPKPRYPNFVLLLLASGFKFW